MVKTYEFKVFEGNKGLLIICINAFVWAMALAFSASEIKGPLFIWAMVVIPVILVGSCIYIFRQMNRLCRFEVYDDKFIYKFLSGAFGAESQERIVYYSNIASYSSYQSSRGDNLTIELHGKASSVEFNRSQYSKGEEQFKELVDNLEECFESYNEKGTVENHDQPPILKGKPFLESKAGKIFSGSLAGLLLFFTGYMIFGPNEIGWYPILRLIGCYIIVLPLFYRSFIGG
jgi:hypothetical protein